MAHLRRPGRITGCYHGRIRPNPVTPGGGPAGRAGPGGRGGAVDPADGAAAPDLAAVEPGDPVTVAGPFAGLLQWLAAHDAPG
jgi:hypothetical protein